MPGANEVLGSPRKYFVFLWRPFFSRSPKFFTFFASVVKFHETSLLGCPPSAASSPGNDFFNFFFGYLPTFLKKTGPLDAPQGGCSGPLHHPHPPLHVTGYKRQNMRAACHWANTVYTGVHLSNILLRGEPKYWGKGCNKWWKHGRFSIIEARDQACPCKVNTYDCVSCWWVSSCLKSAHSINQSKSIII